MSGHCELLHKILVVGEGNTGKTCLIRRYVHNIFQSTNKATIGVDFALKVLNQNNRSITLQIWDIAGQERYGQMTRVYYQAAVGAMVVCDASRPDTMDLAIKWKQDLDSKVFLGNTGRTIPCVLLVNKVDLLEGGKCGKSKDEMDAFCREHGFVGWFETSAKQDMNVGTSFQALVDHVLEATSDLPNAGQEKKPDSAGPVRKGKKKEEPKQGCKC